MVDRVVPKAEWFVVPEAEGEDGDKVEHLVEAGTHCRDAATGWDATLDGQEPSRGYWRREMTWNRQKVLRRMGQSSHERVADDAA